LEKQSFHETSSCSLQAHSNLFFSTQRKSMFITRMNMSQPQLFDLKHQNPQVLHNGRDPIRYAHSVNGGGNCDWGNESDSGDCQPQVGGNLSFRHMKTEDIVCDPEDPSPNPAGASILVLELAYKGQLLACDAHIRRKLESSCPVTQLPRSRFKPSLSSPDKMLKNGTPEFFWECFWILSVGTYQQMR
ncbi:hypothetical protein STEG23_019540, partial [Scotinomys teguina]